MDDEWIAGADARLWPASIWFNSFADSDDAERMHAYDHDRAVEYTAGDWSPAGGGAALYKISWTLTPQVATIAEGVYPGRPHSLLELTEKAGDLRAWAAEEAARGLALGNVLLTDFVEASAVVDTSLAMNGLGRETLMRGASGAVPSSKGSDFEVM